MQASTFSKKYKKNFLRPHTKRDVTSTSPLSTNISCLYVTVKIVHIKKKNFFFMVNLVKMSKTNPNEELKCRTIIHKKEINVYHSSCKRRRSSFVNDRIEYVFRRGIIDIGLIRNSRLFTHLDNTCPYSLIYQNPGGGG